MNNRQIRFDIINILDDNSQNIPNGVYLELCNKLQQFKFTDVDRELEIDEVINAGIRASNARIIARNEQSRIEYERMYIRNPVTGRDVLRTGRVGRRLARQ